MATEEDRRKLDNLLAELKELYTQICQLVPPGASAEETPVPDERKRVIVTLIHHLLLHDKQIDGILKASSLDGLPQPVSTELLRFYREQLIPDKKRLQNLFLDWIGLPNVDIDLGKVHPSTEDAPIWHILVSGFDGWSGDESGAFSTEELDTAGQLLFSSFFEPDQWMRNSHELHPVSGEGADRLLPSNIRVRVRELYHSFVLGNYLAAIALTRAMLEYAIVEYAARLDIKPYFTDQIGRKRNRRLRELVEELSEKIPILRLPMETIIDAGNRTLHPEQKDRLVLLPDMLHDVALDSISATRDVLEQLYLRRE